MKKFIKIAILVSVILFAMLSVMPNTSQEGYIILDDSVAIATRDSVDGPLAVSDHIADSINAANELKAERKKQIDALFSAWDGSHIKLTKAIKKGMNDPSSYEHVETIYWEMGDNIVVLTTYRGNNPFGAKILSHVKVVTDLKGNIIQVLEQE